MHLLTCEQITKSYGTKPLIQEINFSIHSEDKIGLVGANGAGKSTLLKIISGVEPADAGQIMMTKNLKINYMEQEPQYHDDNTVLEQIFDGNSEQMQLIKNYEAISRMLDAHPEDEALQASFAKHSEMMITKDLFDLEFKVKSVLLALGISNFEAKIGTLSGGQKKRVALAEALVTPCDLLILDEPTNHLDSKTILWLENYLKSRTGALLMITHDRYFLDRIANKTVELANGNLYEYQGNYGYYLEKKAERMAMAFSERQKQQNLYKRELAWMRAGVQARGTKSKSRIQRFEALKSQMTDLNDGNIEIEAGFTRLGSKIIELKGLGMAYDGDALFKDFEYTFTPNDRIGIVGDNGVGKSTLMNLIHGDLSPTTGTLEMGSTVKFGYFTQDFDGFSDDDKRAIDYIKEIAEYVTTPSGYRISASELMETFLFTPDMQWTPIQKLSGGERRRLQLLGILISAPNVLLLDEPTNNLDLDTLQVFEHYLDQFQGVILCVSHDRYFLDRTCDKLLAFEAGNINLVVQNYSDYLENLLAFEQQNAPAPKQKPPADEQKDLRIKPKKNKMTFNELKALETLPAKIEAHGLAIEALEPLFDKFATDFGKLTELTRQKEQLEEELLSMMEELETLMEKEASLK